MTPTHRRFPVPLLLLSIILLAFFLRLWRLPQTPPGFWYDEAYYAMDAAWLRDGGPWQLFFAGNNGREPIFIYLQALFIWIWGAAPLTSRLIAPLAGTLTVPLVYVLTKRLARGAGWSSPEVAYLAALGLAVSFWHVSLSRGGYRGVLLPLAAALLFYLFWRGWQTRSLRLAALAGLVLGLSQYTYLAARVLPVLFALFGLLWTLLFWLARAKMLAVGRWTSLKYLWVSLVLMAGISALVFAPLGWIFFNHPALFSARTGDVFFTPHSPAELFAHLWAAARLFIDSGDANWRHHLPGRPMLGWLGWLGFWPGLAFCLWRWRRPAHLFLLIALAVLYLPALLSEPPVHALRLSTLLPIYFVIFAVGLSQLAAWVNRRWLGGRAARAIPLALAAVMVLETGLTLFDYFGRWAAAEETYMEYNGPLVDFVQHVVDLTAEGPVMIPFQIYVHPTTRYLLHDSFREQPAPSKLTGPVQLVSLPDNFRMLNVANIPPLPAYAWLARDAAGQGVVYVSRPPRPAEQSALRQLLAAPPTVYQDKFGQDLAWFHPVDDPAPFTAMFTATTPARAIDLNWDNQAQLIGYEVTPEVAAPGQPVTINFYWRSLTDRTFDARLFLQVVDSAGNPINQWEGEAFREDMYRWRPTGLLATQHTLWLGPDTPPGPYLIRMGFFDDRTGQRLPLRPSASLRPAEGEIIDQVQLGLFYVAPPGLDPRQPEHPLAATFGEAITLTGVTLPTIDNSQFTIDNSPFLVTFHWQAQRPTDIPYTVFLQLLDETGAVISGWDGQPFGGLYPTTFWSPGETVVDTFTLPLPEGGLPPGRYRLITGFYDFATGQRLTLPTGVDFAELAQFDAP